MPSLDLELEDLWVEMHRQSGVTLTELVVLFAVAALIVVSTVTLSVPWLAREGLRSATHEIQSTLQLGRIEAVNRNRACRLLVDTSNGQLQILDSMGTDTTADDERLHVSSIPQSVSFARPDSGAAVTFTNLGGSLHEVEFDPDGTVGSGNGEVVLFGGGMYHRVTLYVAGGIQIEQWTGSGWES